MEIGGRQGGRLAWVRLCDLATVQIRLVDHESVSTCLGFGDSERQDDLLDWWSAMKEVDEVDGGGDGCDGDELKGGALMGR